MKNNRVNVIVRVRPLLDSEVKRGETSTDLMSIDHDSNMITLKGNIDKSY